MDKSAITYAVQRVRTIAATKINNLQKPKPVNEQIQEFIKDFKAGELKLSNRRVPMGRYLQDTYLYEVFDLSKYLEFDVKKEDKTTDKIKKEADRICDELMLGDAEEALKLIRAFEEFK